MNRRIEDWSTSVWSTWLSLAYGEMTRKGTRSPYPHRISNTEGWFTGRDWPFGAMHLSLVASAVVFTPYRTSRAALWEWCTFGGGAWSYHPSESSQASITAVDDHSGS